MILFNKPIPGQSLTTTPKNHAYERPPAITSPDEALDVHLKRLSNPKAMEDILQLIEGDVDIRTLVEGILRAAVINGVHSIDVSLIIAPVIHEYIKGLPLAAGIPFKEGFEDVDDVEEAMYKKPEENIEEQAPEKTSGLMARV